MQEESISADIRRLHGELDALEQRVEEVNKLLQSEAVARLINGHLESNVDRLFNIYGLSFRYEQFMTVLFRPIAQNEQIHTDAANDCMDMIRSLLDEALGREFDIYIAYDYGVLPCLLNCSGPGNDDAERFVALAAEAAEKVAAQAEIHCGLPVCVYISKLYTGIHYAGKCAGEARSLMEYCRILGLTKRLALYRDYDLSPRFKTDIVYGNIHKRLLSSVRARNYPTAKRIINEIIDDAFYRNPLPIGLASLRLALVQSLLLDALNEAASDIGGDFSSIIPDASEILEAQTVAGLTALAEEYFNLLNDYVESMRLGNQPDWIMFLQEYINQNLCNSEINVSTLANVYGIPPTTLSRMFVKHTGVGLPEYVNNLRLERAKEALRNGGRLDDIARQVGYGSTRTMIRAFRKYEGVTPAKLGRIMQAQRENDLDDMGK